MKNFISDLSVEALPPLIKKKRNLVSNESQSDDWGAPQKIISGFKQSLLEYFVRVSILKLILRNCTNPTKIIHILKTLDRKRRAFLGESRLKKFVNIDGRIFWDVYSPGWKSLAFNKFIKGEVNRIFPIASQTNQFNNVFISVTNKCSYKCEHCYEWDVLNKKENLQVEDKINIVKKFQELGTGQIIFSGGEPMLVVDELVKILNSSKAESDFWVVSSGYNFTKKNALALKLAGLTGVFISLDHFDEKEHNAFRGVKHSFENAKQAIINAKAAKLVVAISICITKSFANESNLLKYAHLAKEAGVSFIQLLEPKEVGHYSGKDVVLKPEHEKVIEDFFWKMNYNKEFRNYPIVSYHGYYQRRSGCLSAGNRNLYVDADGEIHACPFCQSKKGNVLSDDLEKAISNLQSSGCHRFQNAVD